MAPCSLSITILIHSEIPHIYSDKHSVSKAVEGNKAAQFVLSLSFGDDVAEITANSTMRRIKLSLCIASVKRLSGVSTVHVSIIPLFGALAGKLGRKLGVLVCNLGHGGASHSTAHY